MVAALYTHLCVKYTIPLKVLCLPHIRGSPRGHPPRFAIRLRCFRVFPKWNSLSHSPVFPLKCYPFLSASAGASSMPDKTSAEKPPRLEIVNRDGSPLAPVQTLFGSAAIAPLGDRPLQPNRGTSLNLDWIESVLLNTSAGQRR